MRRGRGREDGMGGEGSEGVEKSAWAGREDGEQGEGGERAHRNVKWEMVQGEDKQYDNNNSNNNILTQHT